MRILVFQDETGLVKRVCQSDPVGSLFVNWLNEKAPFRADSSAVLFPKDWLETNDQLKSLNTLAYEATDWNISETLKVSDDDDVYLVNGHSLCSIDENNVREALRSFCCDIAMIRISPCLSTSRETLKLTPQNQVVGFRRFYKPAIEPSEPPSAWPNVVIVKKDAWEKIGKNGRLSMDFQQFMDITRKLNLNSVSIQAGGQVTAFDSKGVFLNYLHEFHIDHIAGNGKTTPTKCKIIGPVYKGKGVTIESDVTLIGPVLLSDGVHVKSGSVIRRSILGQNTTVEQGRLVNNQMWLVPEDEKQSENANDCSVSLVSYTFSRMKEYRKWSLLSYERFGKRIFDIICSLIVLILLIPVFPLIMLIIKLTSPGPVFYKARRQGLHGRDFDCLKFRTMMLRADSIQERLRVVNQVDGPQFKIDNDPRISGVGKFLRDTCIDELPQFINVLLGEMSIVGPRPSPENENDSCPVWRDARLSVRPGITGLWQICRTRRENSDFQEWVYYDTQYVRNLSFRKDLWICCKTAQKLIRDFLGQFG